jgi:hypothetical protein
MSQFCFPVNYPALLAFFIFLERIEQSFEIFNEKEKIINLGNIFKIAKNFTI